MSSDPGACSTNWSAISRLYGGEHQAGWESFIHRYRNYVAAVMRRRGIPAAEIDAATESFWSYLFQSGATRRADRSHRFRAFLSGVVHNFVHHWRREHSANASSLDELGVDGVGPSREDDDIDLWAAQVVHLGLECLGRRHPEDETILRWFYGVQGDGESASRVGANEIGQRLGRTGNAVHQALFRARARLRRCLEHEVSVTVTDPPALHDELGLLHAEIDRCRPGLRHPQQDNP